MMSTKTLFAILSLAFLLRTYNISNVPPSLNWDENSNLYNAYSILKTGRDEYGKALPLYNRSFDDYKPPLYMYSNVITVALLGMNPLSARLPSALFGTATIALLFFLVKHTTRNNKIALVACVLLSIMPWHLQISRGAFEASIGLFFTTATVLTLVKAYNFVDKPSKKHYYFLILVPILASFGFYSYHSARVLLPLLIFSISLILVKKFLKFQLKTILAFISVGVIFIAPFLILSPKEAISQRFKSTSIANVESSLDIPRTLLKNYLVHYDPNFLFMKGDNNPRHNIDRNGPLYLILLPLILIGIYIQARSKETGPKLWLALLLLSPLPAVPTFETPHIIRSFSMTLPLSVVSAMALNNFISKKQKIYLFFSIVVAISFFLYIHSYFIHYPVQSAKFWQYGYSQAALETQRVEKEFEKIYIHNSLEQGYIFWLTALKYNPGVYQKENRDHFGKYYFSGLPSTESELLVSTPANTPESYNIIRNIYYPSGEIALTLSHPNEQN